MKMKKINIAELLKDCPKGMELDCAIFNDVTLYRIDTSSENEYPIRIETKNGNFLDLTKYGTYTNVEESKCVIFPKGKTTWEGFQRPFKEGDIAISNRGDIHLLRTEDSSYCAYQKYDWRSSYEFDSTRTTMVKQFVLLLKKKNKNSLMLLKLMVISGMKKTKTLEKLVKLRFKIGNRIKSKINQYEYTIIDITKDGYIVRYKTDKFEYHVSFNDEDNFDLIHNKFDITTLKSFESKVLVRDNAESIWFPCFFGGLSDNNDYPYRIIGGEIWKYCIPYEGNEHLSGKKDDCDTFYKNW